MVNSPSVRSRKAPCIRSLRPPLGRCSSSGNGLEIASLEALPWKNPSTIEIWWMDVDGINPAPVDRWFITLFIGFQPSNVMKDFFHPL